MKNIIIGILTVLFIINIIINIHGIGYTVALYIMYKDFTNIEDWFEAEEVEGEDSTKLKLRK